MVRNRGVCARLLGTKCTTEAWEIREERVLGLVAGLLPLFPRGRHFIINTAVPPYYRLRETQFAPRCPRTVAVVTSTAVSGT